MSRKTVLGALVLAFTSVLLLGAVDSNDQTPATSAKERRERAWKVVKTQHELDVAKLRLGKATSDRDWAFASAERRVAAAEFELKTAQQKLKTLTERDVPQRVKQGELDLIEWENNLVESRQEIEQLEKMYADEQIADKAREIVLDRARRRVERVEAQLAQRRRQHETLVDFTLPQEVAAAEHDVQMKSEALDTARHDLDAARLDQEIALLNAQFEVDRLKHELEEAREEEGRP